MNWGFILISYISLLAFGLADNIRGPLFFEILSTYKLSDFAGSFVFAASSFMALLAALANSQYSKYFHQYRMLQVGLVFMGLGFCGMGLANSYPIMLIFVSAFGISVGTLSIAQNYLVSIGTTDRFRTRVLSGLHSMYGLASLTAPIVASEFSKRGWSWNEIFIFVGIIPLIILLGSFYKKSPPPDKVVQDDLKDGFKVDRKKLLMLSFAFSFYVVSEILVSTRLALYLRRDFNYDLYQSSQALFVFFILLLFGRLISSFIHWGHFLRKALLGSLALTTFAIVLGLLVHPWFIILAGFTMAPFYPLAISFMSEVFPKHLQMVIGWAMTIQSFSVVSMHVVVGKFTDNFGLSAALWLGPAVSLIAFFLIYFGVKVEKAHA